MTWDIRNANNPATTEGIVTPNRAGLNSATAIKAPNNTAQQGTPALTQAPVMAGVGAVPFAKWQ